MTGSGGSGSMARAGAATGPTAGAAIGAGVGRLKPGAGTGDGAAGGQARAAGAGRLAGAGAGCDGGHAGDGGGAGLGAFGHASPGCGDRAATGGHWSGGVGSTSLPSNQCCIGQNPKCGNNLRRSASRFVNSLVNAATSRAGVAGSRMRPRKVSMISVPVS